MVKKPLPQLEFDESIYLQPDAVKPGMDASAKKPKPRSKSSRQPLTESQQPFLPGLSRRGRPRSKNPIPATIRASQSRKRRTQAGARRIELLLDPEVAGKLDALMDHFKLSRVEVIGRLVTQAAKRIAARK
jgi:hypothetical protein